MKKTLAILIATLMICSFAACSGQGKDTASSDSNTSAVSASDTASSGTGDTSAQESGASGEASQTASSVESISTEFNGNSSGKIDTTDLFTKRDLLQTPDLSGARTITASDKKTEEALTDVHIQPPLPRRDAHPDPDPSGAEKAYHPSL